MRVPLVIDAIGSALPFLSSAHAESAITERFTHAKAVVLVRVLDVSSQAESW